MTGLLMSITDAGQAILVNAQTGGTDAVHIATLGLTATPFIQAPTITAIPGQFKVLSTIAGQSASETIIHLTGYDSSADTYDVTGFGLYLDDGTLFAVFSASTATPVLSKASLAVALIALDIAFTNNVGSNITFGSALFSYPPASQITKGVAKIATQARVDAALDGGDDAETIVTPKALRARLLAFLTDVNLAITTLIARTITGTGLATGGGDLSASRTIDVPAATVAEITARNGSKALTAANLFAINRTYSVNDWSQIPGGIIIQWGNFTCPNGTTSVLFPTSFPNACFTVTTDGGNASGSVQDNYVLLIGGTITQGGFQARSNQASHPANFIAIGF